MNKNLFIIFITLLVLRFNLTAQYYDPGIGRFVSVDSVTPGGGANSQGLNRYSYCSNNPVKYVDPSGHAEEERNKLLVSAPASTTNVNLPRVEEQFIQPDLFPESNNYNGPSYTVNNRNPRDTSGASMADSIYKANQFQKSIDEYTDKTMIVIGGISLMTTSLKLAAVMRLNEEAAVINPLIRLRMHKAELEEHLPHLLRGKVEAVDDGLCSIIFLRDQKTQEIIALTSRTRYKNLLSRQNIIDYQKIHPTTTSGCRTRCNKELIQPYEDILSLRKPGTQLYDNAIK